MPLTPEENSQLSLSSLLALVNDPGWTNDRENWNRETYPVHAVRALLPAARAEFVEVMRGQLGRGDTLAALTIGEAPMPELKPDLWQLRGAPGTFGLSVRRALVALGQGHQITRELANDLTNLRGMDRLAAAMALEAMGPPADAHSVSALLSVFDQEDGTLLRFGFDALVSVLDLKAHTRVAGTSEPELRAPLQRYLLLAEQDMPSLRQLARTKLREIFERAWQGESPLALDIVYVPSADPALFWRLGTAMFNESVAVPLAELQMLRGHERTYAEALMAVSLERCWVPSVPALAALGARWTVPVLREAMQLPEADAEFVQLAVTALSTLEEP
jgi:hypothetical protein